MLSNERLYKCMYSHTFITNHAVRLYETTQRCGTEPGVKTTPSINICHIYDRRLWIMVHTYACT